MRTTLSTYVEPCGARAFDVVIDGRRTATCRVAGSEPRFAGVKAPEPTPEALAEAAAWARMFKAAPEMLAALRRAYAVLGDVAMDASGPHFFDAIEALEHVNYAIYEATGESWGSQETSVASIQEGKAA